MEKVIAELVERYQQCFAAGLDGNADLDAATAFYTDEFIAAYPGGVAGGKNDEKLKAVLAQGYERYRSIGTKAMRVRGVRVLPIDDLHCVASVGWTATFERTGHPRQDLDFDVHYLVQVRDGRPRIFGWIAGDEEGQLRALGIG
jgi:hypothetical protein